MTEKTVEIPAITCGHCVMTIKREISEIEGVEHVEGDADKKSVTIRYAENATWDEIRGTLKEIGYPPAE